MQLSKEKSANAFINLLLFLYPIGLIGYVIFCIVKNPLQPQADKLLEDIFHVVEIFFIAPIPIFILTGLQKYLKNVAFSNTDVDNRERLASIAQSVLETNLTKHNFISIILSTFFIGLIEKVVINKNAFSNFENNPYYILALGVTTFGMLILFFYLKSSKHNISQLIIEANKANELRMTTDSEKREITIQKKNEQVSRKILELTELQNSSTGIKAEIQQLKQENDKLKKENEELKIRSVK